MVIPKKEVTANRQYKDELYRILFGREEYKINALSLYNAVNGTSYIDVNDIEFVILEGSIYLTAKNDVGFLLNGSINLYEHQSTFNSNMPFRMLSYYVQLCEGLIDMKGADIYGSKTVKIPAPKCVVFYNGLDAEKYPAVMTLSLSDAFEVPADAGYEWTVTVYNLNHPGSRELLDKCEVLNHYTIFVSRVQEYKKTMDLTPAINRAIKECIAEGVLADLLLKHESEVKDSLYAEFKRELHEKSLREEGREELLYELIRKKAVKGKSVVQIADELEETEDVILPLYEKVLKEQ